jgi:hypothetical protein
MNMDNFVTLIGTEEVNRAANRMVEAANSMQRAADQIDFSVNRLEQLYREEQLWRDQQHGHG